ncbi:hypothetical protein [Streptomyces sp. NBC_01012]|uniref:hypothetical protein n=1 Tax=Streptomyces sp. NBC_01012 TaxID=2903717 RepID=UPI0038658BB2|nr:hypothetical protein OG623_18790 [Streptomyces sp. NBC_01012]
MKPMRRAVMPVVSAVVAAAAVTAVAPSAQADAQACTYRPSQLPVPGGTTAGAVTAVAGGGISAGQIELPGSGDSQTHAALWTGDTVTDLGTVPGADVALGVNDVNSAGVAVGYGWELTGSSDGFPIGENHPFRSRDGKLEQLPVPAGAFNVVARAVTANGDVYGDGFGDDINHRTVYYWPADKPGTVTTPAGFPVGSRVEGVDTDGTVAVTAVSDIKGTTRAYLWKGGVATALAMPAGATNSTISAISNGTVVGDGRTADFDRFAVVWGKDGQATKLPDAFGTSDVNSSGLILGTSAGARATTLWQGTSTVATLSDDAKVYTVGDDATLGGSNLTSSAPTLRLPTLWRCS